MFVALGGIAWGLALVIGYNAATMRTATGGTAEGLGQIANIQLLDAQIIAFILAVGFAIVGSIFLSVAAVLARLPKP